jgi:membrane protein DedA with SNARE-associated domain
LIDRLSQLEAGFASNHWLAAGAIILATFILEDAATITAGVLAVGGVIPAPIALGSVYIGIIAGDMGLYGIGRAAISTGWAQRFITAKNLSQGRRWLRRRLIPALVGARFTPGMRAPTFLASGFLRISFWRFFAVITSVAAVWTTGIFAIIYYLGPVVAEAIGKDAWIVGAVIVTMSFGIPLYLRRRAARKQVEQASSESP